MRARLFDSHCHLDDGQFDADRETMIESMPAQGVAACLTCGSDVASSGASLHLASQHEFIFAAAGIHPHEASKSKPDDLTAIERMLSEPKVLALGEIGLDFYYDFSPRDVQEELLSRQLDLAYRLGKPVVLHVREAHGAMLSLLRARQDRLPGGVLHCFSGSAESAAEYEKLGFYISFAGSLTFKNAQKLQTAAMAVSLDRLLIETDSPYLSPVPFRGKRNEPGRVAEVCRFLAQLRGMAYEEMAELTFRNACRLFGIDTSLRPLQAV